MALVLGIIIGLIILFFMKNISLLGAIIAGLVAGVVAKGPVSGVFAGFVVAVLGIFIFSASSFAAGSIIGSMDITGFAIQEIEPISLLKSVFGITGIAACSIAGFIGGFIRK